MLFDFIFQPMMKDQFANYVVQKVLETSNDRQRETLLNLIRVHIDALKKYTYGKHIVVRFEQLSGEGVSFPFSICACSDEYFPLYLHLIEGWLSFMWLLNLSLSNLNVLLGCATVIQA